VILQIFEDNKPIWITIEDDDVRMKNKKIGEGIGLKNIDARATLAEFKVMTDSIHQGKEQTPQSRLCYEIKMLNN
jgi:hypothetical protein